ncbi:hypothetical protein Lal_00006894 [Lupinus albus]|nr:hypothetical protein Lal_00006894 [Lupinus albus]
MSKLQVHQLNQLREIFGRFDMNSDGNLTTLELAALLRSLGLKPSGDQVEVLLANMDSNGNGFVEFDELVSAMLLDIDAQELVNQEQLALRLLIQQQWIYICRRVSWVMAKMGQPLTYRELTHMIKEADTNGDMV